MWMADGEVMVNGHGELVMGNSQEKDGKVKIYDQKKSVLNPCSIFLLVVLVYILPRSHKIPLNHHKIPYSYGFPI
jgi:hypothetical protein